MHPLPNFLVVGASRSGTTSLHHLLAQHPDVFVSAEKELRHFDRNAEFAKGLDAYRAHFAAHSGEAAIGEISPPYFHKDIVLDADGVSRLSEGDDACTRVRAVLRDVRIVITLRDPVTRAFSQYRKNRHQRRDAAESFRAALEDELAGNRQPSETGNCWIYKSRYSTHVRHWMDAFPADRVHVMIFEEWTRDLQPALASLFAFLGVDPAFVPSSTEPKNQGKRSRSEALGKLAGGVLGGSALGRLVDRANTGSGSAELDAETLAFARGVFADDVLVVEELLGRPLDLWRG